MSAWTFFVDVVGMAVTILLMLALGWAAIERGRIHREWVRLQRDLGWKVAQSIDWCMAMAAGAGCA
jgi:hypothetical protein